jgi:cytochrome c peroxidase
MYLFQGKTMSMTEGHSGSRSASALACGGRGLSLCAAAIVLIAVLVMPLVTGGDGIDASGSVTRYKADYLRPPVVPYPEENTHSPERELLGRTLFFDPRLSGSGSMSCASCHDPARAWGDGLPRAIGAGNKRLERRTPTILNLAWAPALFWDGRAESLEAQALGPIESAVEMNKNLDELVRELQSIAGYRSLFARAYSGETISAETIGKAIATFERTIVSGEAPFDRWIAGDDRAISPTAQRGFVLFNEKARCSTCHTGWRFSDDGFYDIGLQSTDLGRGRITPFIELTRFAFKTPTLRNITQRAPYFHDGSARTLDQLVDVYDRGGLVNRPSLSGEIKPLGLTAGEKHALVAFLETLTSDDRRIDVPHLPR